MTVKHAFKLGFAKELALRGLEPDQFGGMLKQGQWRDLGGELANIAFKSGPAMYLALASAFPFLVGGLAGYGWQKVKQVSPADLSQIKDVAMLHEYEAAIKQLERKNERSQLDAASAV